MFQHYIHTVHIAAHFLFIMQTHAIHCLYVYVDSFLNCFVFRQIDIGLGVKPPGYYVQRSGGLFPAPIPADSSKLNKICKLFELLGLFLAKCIQDGRRVDIPLSDCFLKLMCSQTRNGLAQVVGKRRLSFDSNNGREEDQEQEPEPVNEDNDSLQQSRQDNKHDSVSTTEDNQSRVTTSDESVGGGASAKERLIVLEAEEEKVNKDGSKEDLSVAVKSMEVEYGVQKQHVPWFSGILDRNDLFSIDSYRGRFLKDLAELARTRKSIMDDNTLSSRQKQDRIASLTLGEDGDKLEEMM